MKKFTAILLTVIMVASLFISCNNSIAPTVTDETVSVSFTEATSRSLTASLDPFDASKYYWAYKAIKKDNTGLISGQTSFAWIKNTSGGVTPAEGDTGLSGVTIPGFSQGLWEFTLYAYTDVSDVSNLKLAYSGVTQAVLQKNSSNIIKVTVNPNPTGDGKLIIDVSNIWIIAQESDSNFHQNNFTKYVTVTSLTDGSNKTVPSNYTLDLPAGAYKVSVDIMESGKDLVYASGSVVATVYANMETTVSGSLNEYIVPAEFNPAINPDVMNKVVYSAPINSTYSDDVVINKKSGNEDDNKVKAIIPSVAAQAELEKAIDENNVSAGATTENTSIAFSLTVDTTNATEDTLNLEIGMNAVITVQEGETIKQISKEISSLNKYVTVEINLQTALRNVAVTHDSAAMQKLNSLSEAITNENGAYYYDADSGLLTIKTKRFSPYAITYTVPEEAYVAEMNGVKYTSVQAAINAAPINALESESTTIKLLSNVIAGPAFGFPDSMAGSGRNICIDLDGNTYTFLNPGMGSTGTENQAMHLIYGNKLTLTNGTINVSKDTTTIKRMIQNYCDLTLEDVIVDCSNVFSSYNNSICRGSLTVKGNTDLIASSDTAIIFDVDGAYCDNNNCDVSVIFDETYTGTTNGVIEYVSSTNHTSELIIKSGTFTGRITSSGSKYPSIIGGTFLKNPAEFVDQTSYGIVSDNGTYTIGEKWTTYGDTSWYNDTIDELTISTAQELAGFANLVSEGKTFAGKTVKLGDNIDLAGKLWMPIGMKVTECGSSDPTASSKAFKGTFDGQEHTISNMRIDQWYATNGKGNTMYGLGLFRQMDGTIKNLTVKNAIVKATDGSPMKGNVFGIVAGYSYGTVTYDNVHVINCNLATGDISAFGKVGGILGMAGDASGTTTFKNCSVEDTTIAGVYNCAPFAGLAQNTVIIDNCRTENVIWKAGVSSNGYIEIDNAIAKDHKSVVNGMYWNYDDYYIYAAWSNYYNDYENRKNGGLDQNVIYNGKEYNYDGYCHNTIPGSSNE